MKLGIIEELWYGDDAGEEADKTAAKSMAARMGRIIGTKPFPIAAQRLTILTQNPDCSMDEIVGVLESDPALSARLLRLVNSAGFALRTACTSVRHAATLVGTEKLNQVSSTAAILDMYGSSGEMAATVLEHATAVGALCRYLAFHFALPPDELFTCGFLHDIGKLMMLETEGDEYLDLLTRHDDFDTAYVEERERYGYDHALLAGHVLTAWNIPHPVPKVVAWHHHITRAYAESTLIAQMVSTLRLADAMTYAFRQPDSKVQIERLARMEAASYLDISEAQLAAMWEEVRALTERARAIFRGETPPDIDLPQPVQQHGRPSPQSLRAVADARHKERIAAETASTASAKPAPAAPSARTNAVSIKPDADSQGPPAKSARPAAKSVRPAAKSVRPAAKSVRPAAKSVRPAAHGMHPAPESSRGGPQSIRPGAQSPRPNPLAEQPTPRQFPCVVCENPSFAHTCMACHGYVCPVHIGGENDWCQLCQDAYQEAGIPQIGPGTSTILGALLGVVVAAAFFGAASAGAQQPLRLMLGPTLMMMLFGMLVGIGQRWVRRWWFLRTRPDRSLYRKTVEDVLNGVVHSPRIVEISEAEEPSPPTERYASMAHEAEELELPAPVAAEPLPTLSLAPAAKANKGRRHSLEPSTERRRSSRPIEDRRRSSRASARAALDDIGELQIPGAPGLPMLDLPPVLSTPPPPRHRNRVWMSTSSTALADPLDDGLEESFARADSTLPSNDVDALPHTPVSDERAADEQAADERAADEQAASERAADEQAADEQAADERAADEQARQQANAASAAGQDSMERPPPTARESAQAKSNAQAAAAAASPKPAFEPASGTRLTSDGSPVAKDTLATPDSGEPAPVSHWTSVLDAQGTADGW